MNTTVSQYLQSYIQSNFSIIKESNTPFFSPFSQMFLSSLFVIIHKSHVEWKKQEKDNIILVSKNEIFEDPEYSIIPTEIRKKWIDSISLKNVVRRKYVFHILERTIHLHIWFPTILRNVYPPIIMSEQDIETKIQNILKKVYMWLFVVSQFPNKKKTCSNKINIYLYLTNHGKFLPKYRSHMIEEKHANTAFTTGCISQETNVHIYREEEWFKVLMHESFHVLGMDFIDLANPSVNTTIKKIFPIDVQDIRAYETYAETWAETMNLMFMVYFTNLPAAKGRISIVRWIHILEDRFRMEQTFSLFQCVKVLSHYKLNYRDLFIKEKAQKYTESTQVFSYYILKCVWLFHINSFIEFCANQNKGMPSIRFHMSESNLQNYISKMLYLSQSEIFIKKIEDIEKQMKKKENRGNEPNFARTTMRMTMYEFV